ncbi:MAG: acyltransferase family protein [Blastocatellia bacterium]
MADTKSMKRIAGFDQLRFILALWVMLPHCQLVPDFSGQPYTSVIDLAFRAFVNNLFNPVAAVIVFFVISGFCIHLPYRDQPRVALAPYFTRRFVRILTPMAAAFLLAIPLKVEFPLFSDTILWSLVCEEIYYLLYPALRRVAARIGWKRLFGIAFVVAFGLALTTLNKYDVMHGIYPAFGPHLNWLLGLPCWLLGCLLAEQLDSFISVKVTAKQIWLWRFIVWAVTWVCSVLKFHSPIGYPLTLNVFAVLAFFWLQQEIAYHQSKRPLPLLEKAGAWSYSIYLIHLHAQAIYLLLALPALIMPFGWLVHLTFLLVTCYLFYLMIEAPSHRLARRLSKQVGSALTKRALPTPSPAIRNGDRELAGDVALEPATTEVLNS